ncbi:MAG: type I DNA topoisomerase [Desulfobacterales bacterium]|nr:type I DNA topoisomerase [Desulfobacterales bacterium]
MSKPLLVVESPTKIRTLQKYLGKSYNVASTVGHLKDLPQKEMGIDVDNGFKPKYSTIPGKQKVITALKRSAKDASDIYLATDPDREGEAIAWHTADILKKKGRKFYRILFHELTQKAIKEAIAAPSELDRKKYDAQQTRRILDRLVGYQISPLLWRKVKGGLSAGRVQSVAVRIICERERAIQAFEPQEYWSITVHLEGENPPPFAAKLVKKNNKKLSIPDAKTSQAIVKDLSESNFTVNRVIRKTTRRNPLPPFTTSKLQQEAIRKLRFSAKKTMLIAQQLYEGIDLGPGEPVGLITYMRTDSTRISQEAATETLQFVQNTFGQEFTLDSPRFFKNRKKVQDAHEAIRPTAVANAPEKVAPYLSKDQQALYTLIWKRFVASQMKEALINNTSVSIEAGPYLLTASGSSIKFPGFMTLYMSVDEEIASDSAKRKPLLPDLQQGERLALQQLVPKQHFTAPPPRFSEASLVKELEENGIGRPSTYAAILSTIRTKGYVELLKGYFRPTELGYIVNDLLVENFPEIFGVNFTAKMEENLDRIETAEINSLAVLQKFYDPFKSLVEEATHGMLSVKGVGLHTELSCPECQKTLHIKVGKNGPFIACSGYPECSYSRDYSRDEKGQVHAIEPEVDEATDKFCDKCGKPMVIKRGRYGSFLACSGYPDCKYTQSLNSNRTSQTTGVKCPQKDCSGELVERKSKRGKIFYGCNQFPECDFAIWDKPVSEPCPICKAPFLTEKATKKDGTFLACLDKECGYKKSIENDDQVS